MRARVITIVVAGAALGVSPFASANAQAPNYNMPRAMVDSATKAELYSARERIWKAWFANDSAELARLLPPAVVAAEGVNGYEDRAAILADSKGFAASGAKLVRIQFFDTDIVSYGNLAVVHSRYELEVESGGQRKTRGGRATEIFVRQSGGWVNPFWHLES